METIVVTDGEQRAALSTVRSLGRAGYRVVVASTSKKALAAASRYCAAAHRLPDPLSHPDRYLARLSDLLVSESADVLLPITEQSLRAILPARMELAPTRIPFPDAETFRAVSDKARVLQHAAELGIRDPTVGRAGSAAELLEVVRTEDPPYPVVLKPLRSVAPGERGLEQTHVRHVAGAEELERVAATLGPASFPLLIQRRVQGPGIGVFLLMHEDRTVAHFGHRRLREKPPSGGVSVLRESIEVPEPLLRASEALLRSFGWSGVAMVEYKVDTRSGEPYLMEVNGRFWGSLQLAVDAGVDFPLLLTRLALRQPITEPIGYRVGVRTRWLLGDVDHLLLRTFRSPSSLGLGHAPPSRPRVWAEFLRAFFPPVRSEVFRWSDPGPSLLETRDWLTGLVGRQRQGEAAARR